MRKDIWWSINISDATLAKRWFLWGATELVHESPEVHHDSTSLMGYTENGTLAV